MRRELRELLPTILRSSEVRIINLIGGVRTARMLSERAGRTLKRTVMELGGFIR